VEATSVALIATSATTIVTVAGWSVSHVLTTRREDRTRRQEAALKYSERQIEELYGPLQSLIQQIFVVWRVREALLFLGDRDRSTYPDSTDRQKQIVFFQEHYFFPLHERIREILAQKLHLTDGGTTPKSFREYLDHSTLQLIQYGLERELGSSAPKVPGNPWPREFYPDVKDALERIMARADRQLQNLETRGVYRDAEPARR
jgi:hypothetical protein